MLAMVERYLEDILKARNNSDIIALLRAVAVEFGFRSAYIIEYEGLSNVSELVLDTDPVRTDAWATYFKGPLHSHELLDSRLSSPGLTLLGPGRFPGTDDDRYKFAAKNDLLQCVIVPMHHSGKPIGVVGFSGLGRLDHHHQMALQLLGYNLFARTRAFEMFVQDNTPQPLSPREKTVVGMSADGLTSVEIAEALKLSARTVNQYVDNVARKLGTRNRAHAVAEAIRRRLVE